MLQRLQVAVGMKSGTFVKPMNLNHWICGYQLVAYWLDAKLFQQGIFGA